ncbi:hypothetical protein QCE47_02265 [Caballeronia sp. LZ025]|uniref:hypothetical protein n=1 Tax=Caballeronia TaxID=1827195 RepID=UPI001FCFF42B|nr:MULTISPECIES: hypothetical protein [Caballeronia]MDR5731175.1 hypothetical protein [Caballeronia sp. LZ025]
MKLLAERTYFVAGKTELYPTPDFLIKDSSQSDGAIALPPTPLDRLMVLFR